MRELPRSLAFACCLRFPPRLFVARKAAQRSVSRSIQESTARIRGQVPARVDLPVGFAGVWSERLSGQKTLFKVTVRPVRLLSLKYENRPDDRAANELR